MKSQVATDAEIEDEDMKAANASSPQTSHPSVGHSSYHFNSARSSSSHSGPSLPHPLSISGPRTEHTVPTQTQSAAMSYLQRMTTHGQTPPHSSDRSRALQESAFSIEEGTDDYDYFGDSNTHEPSEDPTWDYFAENERKFGLESEFLPLRTSGPFAPGPSYANERSR